MKKIIILGLALCFHFLCFAQLSKTTIDQFLISKGLVPAGNDSYVILSQSSSPQTGITHVYLRQTLNGIEVFNVNPSLHANKEGALVSFQNTFVKNAAEKGVQEISPVSYIDAMTTVATQLGLKLNVSLNKSGNSNQEWVLIDKSCSSKEIKAKQYYLYKNNLLIPVWNIELFDDKTGNWWNKRVDRNTGAIIDENNWTTHCETKQIKNHLKEKEAWAFRFDEEPVLLKKPISASYKVYPFPFESPQKTTQKLTPDASTQAASPYGWHDVNGINGAEYSITRGNNVWAKEDTLDQDSSNGHAPDGGSSLLFNFPNDSNAQSQQFLDAAITNLFYWNNIIHDINFNYGFDEGSGNFQQKNYGNTGLDNDFVFADAQDGSGTNNANFSTPPDGMNPRMQMFLWSVTGSDKLLNINTPLPMKGQYLSAIAGFGPGLNPPGKTANLALGLDNSANPNWACETITSNVSGKIALIDRGSCFFANKVYNAQLAGAIAAIIVNNIPSAPFSMGSPGNGIDKLITIPSVMISQKLGDSLRSMLMANNPINITLVDSSGGMKYYDSDFDNGVIIHEYAHGISNRLTGGAANANCLYNAEQGGEGWSDFFALALTARPWDNPQAGRGIGTYLIGEDTNGVGIRDYLYSRNLAINPVTYDYIKTNTEVHALGFVWATILYDMFWDLVDKHGFDADVYKGKGGNNIAIQLVMDGLKLQPCLPGFVDARDAILLADSLHNKFENRDLLWKTFARRGLGFYADQGSSSDATDGKQNFALPPVKPTGSLQILEDKDLKVYPNPAMDLLNIEVPEGIKLHQISILNLSGKTLDAYPVQKEQEKIIFSLHGIANGIYLLKVETETGVICRKFVISGF